MLRKSFLYESATAALAVALTRTTGVARADDFGGNNESRNLPGYTALKAVPPTATATEMSGLNNQMWGTIVDRDGVVCAGWFGHPTCLGAPGSSSLPAVQ